MSILQRREVIKKKKKRKIISSLIKLGITVLAVSFYMNDLSTDDYTFDHNSFLDDEGNLKAILQLADKTVMQSFAIDEENHEIYVSQVKSGQPKNVAESYVITRSTMDGQMLDSMTLQYGGHGTNIGVEVYNDEVYIWSSYERVNRNGAATGRDLVRFKYRANVTYTPQSPEIENYSYLIDTQSSMQISPAIDNKNRKIAVRQRDGIKKTQWVNVYNLDEVLSHKNPIANTIIIPEYLLMLQGLSLDGDYLYWRTGDSNERKFKDLVSVFDVNSGDLVAQKQVTSGWNSNSDKRFYREPEGIFLYTHAKTGEKQLYVGVVTGKSGEGIYSNSIYTFKLQE
jgi:hypothetical protein